VKVTYPWKLTIGDDCWIGDDVRLYSLDRITLGSNCVVSQSSYLCTGSHDHTTPSFDLVTAPITLEDQCWIAADCFVMPGVTVGRGAVVSARALVTRSVASADIVAGAPARPVGKRRPA
jgi:putative colanic acid biosynthesis acetyltransferase WcaF